jgi:hypothetical protein
MMNCNLSDRARTSHLIGNRRRHTIQNKHQQAHSMDSGNNLQKQITKYAPISCNQLNQIENPQHSNQLMIPLQDLILLTQNNMLNRI